MLNGGPALAQNKGLALIRDAEIENIIRRYSAPVFEAAGIQPDLIKIYLVNDNTLNAFVAGGRKIFINTGLLIAADHPGQVIGVIAHETGHIVGRHLARQHEALAKSTAATILGIILGGAAAAAGGGEAAAVVIAGSQGVAQGSFLAYSRSHEASADHAAINYLERTGQSAKGLYEFLIKLENQELLITASRDPYLRTHPLTRDRLETMEHHIEKSKFSNVPVDPELVSLHARMKAKLIGFMTPGKALVVYKRTDKGQPARYARAIAYFRTGKIEQFRELIDGLLAEFPNDPYFHEIKGQGLHENGDAAGALKSYARAVELLPSSDLLRLELARIQINMNDRKMIDAAIENLQFAIKAEPFDPSTLEQLGNAYYKKQDEARARLYHADAAFLRGNMDKAIFNGEVASRSFRNGTAEWLRAEDIINAARIQKDRAAKQ
ncbi:MAG: M48 family metalloprotease [Rhodospirillaceae bacterium]